jgi:hypothetical protein
MVKFERKRTWEKFVMDLKEDYKGKKKLLYAVMNKIKPKTKLSSILDKNGKLVWTKHAYFKTWMEHFKDLLKIQNYGEESTENNRVPENGNISDKVEMNVLNLEIVITQMKNNKSPGYDEIFINMIKAVQPIVTQLLHRVLTKLRIENRTPEDW